MNKQDLIAQASKITGISQVDIAEVLNPILEIIADTLSTSEPVSMHGFGTFFVKELKGRVGINPQTKEKITIPAKKVIKFRSSPKIVVKSKESK